MRRLFRWSSKWWPGLIPLAILWAAAAWTATVPLEADLTAHVDFQALGLAAGAMGAAVHGPMGQGEWLRRLGIVERAQALKAHATAAQRHDIDAALDRLTGAGRTTMGELFKVMALADPRLGPLPGFDS